MFQYHQVIRFCANLLLSILLVKSTLSTSEISMFESLMFITNVLTMVWMIGVTQAFSAQYSKKTETEKHSLISSGVIILLVLALLVSLLLYIFRSSMAHFLFNKTDLPFLYHVIALIVLSTPCIMIEYTFLVKNKPLHIFHYTHINFGFYILLCLLTLWFKPEVDILLSAIVLWSALKFIFLFLVTKIKIVAVNSPLFRDLLVSIMPLSGAAILGVGMDYVDNILVLHYFDNQFYAVFRYGARELPLSLLLFSSLSNAIVPRLVYFDSEGSDLRDRTLRLMHWLFPPAIILMFISPYLFEWVYSYEFVSSAYIFNIYLLILISRVLLPQSYNLAKKQTRILFTSGLLELVLNIVLSVWWVKIWGIYGLAMATVVAYFVQKVILVEYNRRINRIPLSRYINTVWYAYYSVLLLLAFGLSILLKQNYDNF